MIPEPIRLAAHVAQALKPAGGDLGRSLFGDAGSRAVDTCPPTEFQALAADAPLRSLETLGQLLLPALSGRLPAWTRLRPRLKPVARLFLRPSRVYRYRPAQPLSDPTPDQAWFFLNGIATDRHVLMLNAAYLTRLFQRPLTLLHHPSCGLLPDLLDCTLGKGGRSVSATARMAFAPLYAALKAPATRRVVLLAHSQGTIVAGVLLWLLRGLYEPTQHELFDGEARCPEQRLARTLARRWQFPCTQSAAQRARSPAAISPPLTREELAKLELYAFANCASLGGAVDRMARLPYIESYGNEFDALAHLGVLAAPAARGVVRIGGERFVRPGAWGHLLNAHYLHPMEQEWRAAAGGAVHTGLRPLPGNRARRPRLFGYFGGATPDAARAEARGVLGRAGEA